MHLTRKLAFWLGFALLAFAALTMLTILDNQAGYITLGVGAVGFALWRWGDEDD